MEMGTLPVPIFLFVNKIGLHVTVHPLAKNRKYDA